MTEVYESNVDKAKVTCSVLISMLADKDVLDFF